MNYLPILLAAAFLLLNGKGQPEKPPASLDLGKIAPLLANPDALNALKCVNRLFDKNTPSTDRMPIIFELMGNPFVSELLSILGSSFNLGFGEAFQAQAKPQEEDFNQGSTTNESSNFTNSPDKQRQENTSDNGKQKDSDDNAEKPENYEKSTPQSSSNDTYDNIKSSVLDILSRVNS